MKDSLNALGYMMLLLSTCCVTALLWYLVGKIKFGRKIKRQIKDHPVANRPFRFDNRTSKQVMEEEHRKIIKEPS